MRCAAALVLAAVTLSACSGDPDPAPSPTNAHLVIGPRLAVKKSTLTVASGADQVTVRVIDIGDDLFRASTPDATGPLPKVVPSGDDLTVTLEGGAGGPANLYLEVSESVDWSFRFTGGAKRLELDSDPVPAAVDVTAGVSQIVFSLPKPTDSRTYTVSGGASTLTLIRPADVPVRARLTGGAGSATVDGKTSTGLAGNSVVTSPTWGAAPGYELDVPGGIGSLVVTDR